MLKTSKGKRQKGDEVMVDRLSGLPDSVLSHILSFLPTEPGFVATSLVSRRWRNLWTWVHTLHFYGGGGGHGCYYIISEDGEDYHYQAIGFEEFVNGVMRSIKGSIKQFKLACELDNCLSDDIAVRNWISTAIDRGVKYLSLDMRSPLPSFLFNSKTLVDLELCDIHISNLETPSAPFLPTLKKLHLSYTCRFVSTIDSKSFKRLISGCSALEDLRVHLDFSITLNISSLTLKKLELQSHHEEVSGDKIVLAVPSLELLKMKCFPSEFLIENQISSLVEVDICFFNNYFQYDDLCRDSFERFLQLISSVKILRWSCCFEKPLTLPMTMSMNAKYNNLTELKIESPFFEWTLIRSLMERSINLESVTLEQNRKNHNKDHQVLWNDPEHVPRCLLSSLRKVSITGYGIEDELDMVKYVLENARVLERMDIRCLGDKDDYKLKFQVLQKIVMIRRASRCEISFV